EDLRRRAGGARTDRGALQRGARDARHRAPPACRGHVVVGLLHHRSRRSRNCDRATQGARYPIDDLLSAAAASAAALCAPSGAAGRPSGHRGAGIAGHEPADPSLPERSHPGAHHRRAARRIALAARLAGGRAVLSDMTVPVPAGGARLRVGLDSRNLMLSEGTGVATYGRTLLESIARMGGDAELVLDIPGTPLRGGTVRLR